MNEKLKEHLMKVFKDAEPDEDGKLSLQSVKNIIEEHKDFQQEESVNLTGIFWEKCILYNKL